MPRIRSSEIGRRSGRFDNQPAATTPLRIISSAASDQHYRIYNTGPNDITISPGSLTVGARSSVDLQVASGVSIDVAGGVLEGIYDRIDIPRLQVRSGRFRYTAAETIINSVTGLYRFFNTRRAGPSRIIMGGTNYNIRRGCTMDVSVNASHVEARGLGVYDLLGMETAVRSGHFQTDTTIDIAVLTTTATYRFFNSGDNDYGVRPKGGSNIATVRPFSSVDLVLPAATIEVVTSGSTPIQGAYDFIQ